MCNTHYFGGADSHVAQHYTECIVALPLQQWISERSRILRHTYIAYVINLYRTVWKWFTGSRDRNCTDPLQATALTHILRLQVSNSLQYPATYSYDYDLI
jgi:hypothetical protein